MTPLEERIAVLAPSANDGPVTAGVLAKAGFECFVAWSGSELCRVLDEGAAAALVAEEALAGDTGRQLADLLRRQPPWSDLPVLILTAGGSGRARRLATVDALAPFGNVTLLDRPVEVITIVSAVRSALRARRRQYAARAALAEMDAILQAIPFAVYFGNEHGIERCNAEALRMLGASSLEDLQRRIGELAATFRMRTRQEGGLVEPQKLPFARALAGEVATLDTWVTKVATGEDVLVRGNAAPVVIAGRPVGAVAVNIDITDQWRLQEELRASEARFRTMADGTPVMIWVNDASGRIEFANAAYLEFFGATLEAVQAQGWEPLVHPDDAPSYVNAYLEAARQRKVFHAEARVRRADGAWRWIESTGVPRLSPTGEFLGYAGSSPDVTDRKEAEAELREADRQKTEFLGVLSHELRNPLVPIRNSVHLLAHAPPGSDQALRARQVIDRQTAHLARLVDDLLDVTRIERGKVELRRTRVDARDVVRRACEDHRGLFEARGIELDLRLSRPAWIDADPTRVAQLVGNLLQNAAKFSVAGQAVSVSVSAIGSTAEIAVRDEGVGIAPDLLPRLFKPFVQADAGLSRGQGGLGLGLSLVKALAELHGGTVAARSDGIGKGAEFVVALPLAAAPATADPSARRSPPARPLRVLVIDDNADGAQTLAELLRLEGHTAEVATDGRSGLARARAQRFDVVLCDIGLPGMDGFEVARRLRADGAAGRLRLVALTGYAQPEDRQRAFEAGFDAHVAKPPDPETLLRAVEAEDGPSVFEHSSSAVDSP